MVLGNEKGRERGGKERGMMRIARGGNKEGRRKREIKRTNKKPQVQTLSFHNERGFLGHFLWS